MKPSKAYAVTIDDETLDYIIQTKTARHVQILANHVSARSFADMVATLVKREAVKQLEEGVTVTPELLQQLAEGMTLEALTYSPNTTLPKGIK